MRFGLQGWLAVGFAICVVVMAVAAALSNADKRADAAELKTGVVAEQKRGETIRAETNEAVAVRTDEALGAQVRVERVTSTVIREVQSHAAAATPIDPALARAWVAGLERVCDEAGPGVCAGETDRLDGDARSKPVPARPAS